MPRLTRPRPREARPSERGQILVIVAVGMIAMLAMAGLVIDTGNAWANRRQAQNVADAAALAGTRIISVDRYEKAYDPTAPATFANPGAAIQQAILNVFQYNANPGQSFNAVSWGSPGSPEYTDHKGRRFPNAQFASGPLYVQSGPIPGEAQGVHVPATAVTNTIIMQVVGIDTIPNGVNATAVTGPTFPLGKLLPLVIRERYTPCANSSGETVATCDPGAVRTPLSGPVPYQRTFQEGCVYSFRQINPSEIACNGSTDPSLPTITNPDYSGSFGWIDWDGGNSPTAQLNPWISNPSGAPTAWFTTPCADPAADETCRIAGGTLPIPKNDLFWRLGGTTGNRNTSVALVDTLYLNKEVYVPIWRESENPGTGTASQFEVIGFGVFEIETVYTTGSNKGFDGRFLGSFRGGEIEQCTIVPSTCPGSGAAPLPFAINLSQ